MFSYSVDVGVPGDFEPSGTRESSEMWMYRRGTSASRCIQLGWLWCGAKPWKCPTADPKPFFASESGIWTENVLKYTEIWMWSEDTYVWCNHSWSNTYLILSYVSILFLGNTYHLVPILSKTSVPTAGSWFLCGISAKSGKRSTKSLWKYAEHLSTWGS